MHLPGRKVTSLLVTHHHTKEEEFTTRQVTQSIGEETKQNIRAFNMVAKGRALFVVFAVFVSMKSCAADSKWMNVEMCDMFRSANFKSMVMATRMRPSLGRKLFRRFKECFRETHQFAEHVDVLGSLACYYDEVPALTPELSWKLLAQLELCDNPNTKKRQLLQAVTSNSNWTGYEVLSTLGTGVAFLSAQQLANISNADLKEMLQNRGPNIHWTKSQIHRIVRKLLGEKMCGRADLLRLAPVIEGVPNFVLEHVSIRELANNTEVLRNISKRMRRSQLKAMLRALRRSNQTSELVHFLPGTLLRGMSLQDLDDANISTPEQVRGESLKRSQAAFLARKFYMENKLHFWNLGSILQGVTCEMIANVADVNIEEMVQAIEETPCWLSKLQVGCAARRYFAAVEEGRRDYFKNITEEEFNTTMPIILMIHLRPSEWQNLPDSFCNIFLNKLGAANLTSLPHRSPSRLALPRRALQCLTKEKNTSELTVQDVSRLGPLLCELDVPTLSLLAHHVLNVSLWAMSSCQHIPLRNRPALMQLVRSMFGDPSEWDEELMESLGGWMNWDDSALSALPHKPWMIDVLHFLRPRLPRVSKAMRRKLFDLIASTNEEVNGTTNYADMNRTSLDSYIPTVSLIRDLGKDNVFWSSTQLDKISQDTFLETMETLGSVPDYKAEQLAVLTEKAIEALGPVPNMSESIGASLGCIARGFSNSDLEMLSFSIDRLEDVAHCGWNDSQLRAVWKSVSKRAELTAQQLKTFHMVALNQFMCGLNASEIAQLDAYAFRDAVGSLNDIRCSLEVARHFKSLAVLAFGPVGNWTEALVAEMGNLIVGLDADEMASLDPSLLSFFQESSIPLFPADNIAALSVAQLEGLGPDNVAMVTQSQRDRLTDAQLAALEQTEIGSRSDSQVLTNGSGAPTVSVEGVSGFVKPFLVLLICFVLL
ncbi:otoancorin isoform X2 [Festucalex cinctus]